MANWRRSKAPAWAASIAAVLLLCVLLVGVWQFWVLQGSFERQARLVTLAVTQRDELLQMVNEETGVRGLLATGDARFLQIYYQSLPQRRADATIIRNNLFALPALEQAERSAQSMAVARENYFSNEIDLTRAGHIAVARARLSEGRVLFDRFRRADAAAERQVNDQLKAQRAHTRLLAQAGFLVSLVVSAALILGAVAFIILLQRARAYRLTSMRDSLTGAANRRGARSAIQERLDDTGDHSFGLVFIDLDGFKKVNDAYGHAAGDAILKEVAIRLRAELRDGDVVCRMGGDEFVCVVGPPSTMDGLSAIAARLRKAVARPYVHDNDSYVVGCSAGVSLYPQHGSTVDSLLARADYAMYNAKAAGGGIYVSP
jgi:diguanylate cyclase (GGDEF)-like protein